MGQRKPYYGVAKGRTLGVFTSWFPNPTSINNLTLLREDCELSVKGFSGAIFKGFNSQTEATSFVAGRALMEKQRKDSESAGRMDRQQNRSVMDPSFTNSSVAQNNGAERRSTARMGSCSESDEDDFITDGTSPSRAYFIDDDPPFPSDDYRNSNKRPSPNPSSIYNYKKPKTRDLEIVDLTDSPPSSNRYNRYNHSSPEPAEWQSSLQAMKSLIDSHPPRETIPKKFTLHDCSDEQKHILNLVSQGKNVFFTGSAGVGKSFVLTKISQLFKSKGLKQFVDFFITASTGTSHTLSS